MAAFSLVSQLTDLLHRLSLALLVGLRGLATIRHNPADLRRGVEAAKSSIHAGKKNSNIKVCSWATSRIVVKHLKGKDRAESRPRDSTNKTQAELYEESTDLGGMSRGHNFVNESLQNAMSFCASTTSLNRRNNRSSEDNPIDTERDSPAALDDIAIDVLDIEAIERLEQATAHAVDKLDRKITTRNTLQRVSETWKDNKVLMSLNLWETG